MQEEMFHAYYELNRLQCRCNLAGRLNWLCHILWPVLLISAILLPGIWMCWYSWLLALVALVPVLILRRITSHSFSCMSISQVAIKADKQLALPGTLLAIASVSEGHPFHFDIVQRAEAVAKDVAGIKALYMTPATKFVVICMLLICGEMLVLASSINSSDSYDRHSITGGVRGRLELAAAVPQNAPGIDLENPAQFSMLAKKLGMTEEQMREYIRQLQVEAGQQSANSSSGAGVDTSSTENSAYAGDAHFVFAENMGKADFSAVSVQSLELSGVPLLLRYGVAAYMQALADKDGVSGQLEKSGVGRDTGSSSAGVGTGDK